jgi:hypothetical protein
MLMFVLYWFKNDNMFNIRSVQNIIRNSFVSKFDQNVKNKFLL